MSAERADTASRTGLPGGWPAVPGLPRLEPGDLVHLVGIAGAGMSGLARVLDERGIVVSGSDRTDSDTLRALAGEGLSVRVGHSPANLPAACALVVRSPAVPDDNAEVAAARAAGLPVAKRAEMLGALIDAAIGVCVAGTHGKTTLSGLIAFILVQCGLDPTFFVGGDLPDLGANARAGRGPHVVVEADEYDRTFLHGHAAIAVVTSIEHDHPDIYPDRAAVAEAFGAFLANVRPDGLVIARAGDPMVHAAMQASAAPAEYYGLADEARATEPRVAWRAEDLTAASDGSRFDVYAGNSGLGTFTVGLPGRHNVANALAAIAACRALGVPLDGVRDAVARYRGAARRFQPAGRVGRVTVIDDYAHHPTEVRATIAAARERYPGARIVAVAQPHTYSRVAAMARDFGAALGTADRIVVTPVYAAREAPIPGADARRIVTAAPAGSLAANDLADAAGLATDGAHAGDVLLFMGAGDITDASVVALTTLARRVAREVASEGAATGIGGALAFDAPLAALTSLKIGGPATMTAQVDRVDDLRGWLELAARFDLPARVLGRGSNVLAADAGFAGLVVVNRCESWRIDRAPDGRSAIVVADSGVTLTALGNALARAGWAGIEAGTGIPGSVGAAVVINAGAHGWSMADSVCWADVLEPGGCTRRRAGGDLALTYRSSALKGDRTRTVMAVAIRVKPDDPAAIRARIEAFAARRRATQPTGASAGSIFRNPAGDYAGRMIEAAGLKGARCGAAEISPVHANFVINRGGATASDVAHLITLARARVRRSFGVTLELEIELLGACHVA